MTVFDVPKACIRAVQVSPVSKNKFVKYLLACRQHKDDYIIALRGFHKTASPATFYCSACTKPGN